MPTRFVACLKPLSLAIALSLQAGVVAAVGTYSLTTLQSAQYHSFTPPAIAGWLTLTCLPALLLSPLIGALAGSRRAWETMVVAAAASTIVVAYAIGVPDLPWLSVLGVIALASAFFAAAGLRLIFATLQPCQIRSTTAMVLVALGVLAMLSIGFHLGLGLRDELPKLPARSCYAIIAIAAFALLTAILARVRPAESIPFSQGIVRPFAAGVHQTLRSWPARNSLIGLWIWMLFAGTISFVVVRLIVAADDPRPERSVENFTTRLAVAALCGAALTALNRNSFRFGWLILYSAIAMFVCIVWLRFAESADGPVIGIGLSLGAALPALMHYFFTWNPPRLHGVAAALVLSVWCLAGLLLAALVAAVGGDLGRARETTFDSLLVVAGLATLLAAFRLYRPALEGTVELLLWPMYRVRAVGPGVVHLPARGPCLVIGNHAAWFDPLFLAKVLPMPTTPMMTSKFYDLPVLSWLMRRVIGTIRVPDVRFRHEAPELKEAVAALDRGECVVLFPEGYLRRKEEQPLRRFGRGIWAILAERPHTPVFACWIEGNWGSFFSHRGGPPTKGKRIDFWKHIDIGIVGPVAIDPAMLADHMATRLFLMHQVAAAREPLGLPPVELPMSDEGEKE
jgi:1-acyl-sn-glycerol-3-phosphate acyltransferase